MMSPMDIGRELARLRDEAGLLQRQVGAVFDIDKSAVSQWEKGESTPTVDKIGRLDDLYGGRGEVLALYGIKTRDAEVAQLRANLKAVVAQVEALASQVGQLLGVSTVRAETDENWPQQASTDG